MLNNSIHDFQSIDQWQHWAKAGQVYFLAESAINEDILQMKDGECLYWGELGKVHASISPYLFRLSNWDVFAKEVAFQANWGVLLKITPEMAPFGDAITYLVGQLREWTFVELPNQEQTLLRLSDFEVVKVLCEASSDAELNGIFGSVLLGFAYWEQGKEKVESLIQTEKGKRVPYRSPQLLSEKQYQALTNYALLIQHKSYAEHLKTHHDEVKTWSTEQLANFLNSNINKAQDYDFHNQQDTVRFLSLAVVLGENFDQTPWASAILQAKEIQGAETRMDRLYQAAFDEIDKEKK